jgi:predicted acetyltransferase
MHKYQRQRFGTKVAHKTWGQFKGNWQVRVLVDNQPANLFWLQAIDLFTNGSFKTTTMTIEKNLWIIYKFESIKR